MKYASGKFAKLALFALALLLVAVEADAQPAPASGIVYGQNPPDLPEKPKAAFEARLKTPAMKDVAADIRPFDDPVPPGVHDLDLITFLFFYHDTTYLNADRAK